MDLSLEAIQQDLDRAEMAGGRPEALIHSQRALIRATLRAQQPAESDPGLTPLFIASDAVDIAVVEVTHGKVYFVPATASYGDRTEAAARILRDLPIGSDDAFPIRSSLVVPEFTIEPEGPAEDVFADAKKAKKR